MSKACKTNDCVRRTSIGGQALIEGIMMRGPKITAMAVRNPKGEIVLEQWETKQTVSKWTKVPLIRGVVNFVLSMKIGYRALMRSAEISIPEDEEVTDTVEAGGTEAADAAPADGSKKADDTAKKKKSGDSSPLMTVLMLIASVLGVGLSVLLFIMLPTFLYGWLTRLLPFLSPDNRALNSLVKSAFEGILKIVILVAYMLLVTLMKDIRRTFQYHGAEHKTIFCYEHGHALTVENVRREGRFHPRCGTSFLILMLLVGMFVSFFIDPVFLLATDHVAPTALRAVLKLVLLPLSMGLGYELIKLAGKYDNRLTRIISAPGKWLQHITVLEPTDDMIECAILAFQKVLPPEEKDAASLSADEQTPTEA